MIGPGAGVRGPNPSVILLYYLRGKSPVMQKNKNWE